MSTRNTAIIAIMLALAIGAFFMLRDGSTGQEAAVASATSAPRPSFQPEEEIRDLVYTETYTHTNPSFSFRHPTDFRVASTREGAGELITVQNTSTGTGLQIYITPADPTVNTVTIEEIQRDLPDLVVRDVQEVLIGEGNGKGVAFLSDNPLFSGDSREVWFAWGGWLYQISTYTELDAFLQGLFGTWEFN